MKIPENAFSGLLRVLKSKISPSVATMVYWVHYKPPVLETLAVGTYVKVLFNKQNNKQYGSFSQNKPTLREFITSSDADFDIVQATLLEERPGNIRNSSFTGFFVAASGIYAERSKI